MENNNIFLGKIEKNGCYVNNGKYGYFLTCGKKNYKIPYKQALKDASPSYKTRNENKQEDIKQETPIKLKRKSNKKSG